MHAALAGDPLLVIDGLGVEDFQLVVVELSDMRVGHLGSRVAGVDQGPTHVLCRSSGRCDAISQRQATCYSPAAGSAWYGECRLSPDAHTFASPVWRPSARAACGDGRYVARRLASSLPRKGPVARRSAL